MRGTTESAFIFEIFFENLGRIFVDLGGVGASGCGISGEGSGCISGEGCEGFSRGSGGTSLVFLGRPLFLGGIGPEGSGGGIFLGRPRFFGGGVSGGMAVDSAEQVGGIKSTNIMNSSRTN